MDMNSQNKLLSTGFRIIRKDDYPQARIKGKERAGQDWRTVETFKTKAARDRTFKEMLQDPKVISD